MTNKNSHFPITIKPKNESCRICLENNKKALIYPCNCTFPVHKYCLIKWIKSTSNNNPEKCEICKTDYNCDFIIIVNRNEIQVENNEIQIVNNENNIHNSKKHCFNMFIISIFSADLYFSYCFMYTNNNFSYFYIAMLINFVIVCLLGTYNRLYRNNQNEYTNLT